MIWPALILLGLATIGGTWGGRRWQSSLVVSLAVLACASAGGVILAAAVLP